MSEPIRFKTTYDPYGFLHNFAKYVIIHQNKLWATSEHLYQSLKFNDEDPIREKIRMAATPKDAAILGRTSPGVRSDWDQVKLEIMKLVLRLKATQHPHVADRLVATGDSEIIEVSHRDTFWGSGPDGNGRNHLGRLWMEIRSDLRTKLSYANGLRTQAD